PPRASPIRWTSGAPAWAFRRSPTPSPKCAPAPPPRGIARRPTTPRAAPPSRPGPAAWAGALDLEAAILTLAGRMWGDGDEMADRRAAGDCGARGAGGRGRLFRAEARRHRLR